MVKDEFFEIRSTKKKAKLSIEEQCVLFNTGSYDATKRLINRKHSKRGLTLKKFKVKAKKGDDLQGGDYSFEKTLTNSNTRDRVQTHAVKKNQINN